MVRTQAKIDIEQESGDSALCSAGTAWGFTSILLFIYVLNWADKAIIGLAAQPLAREFGLTTSQIGLLGSAFYLTFTIGGFFAGALHKRFSIKWALLVLALVWAAAMAVPVFAVGGFALLVVSRMVLGFGEGPSAALVMSGVYSWHPTRRRGLPSALAIGSASIAKIVFAPVLAVVIASWGWRAAFLALVLLTFVWIAIWVPVWRDGPYAGREEERTRHDDGSNGVADVRSVPWRRIFLTRSFAGGVVAMLAAYSTTAAMLTFLPTYFQVGLGVSQQTSGTLLAVVGAIGLAISLSVGFVGDQLMARGTSSRLTRGIVPGTLMLIGGILFISLYFQPGPFRGVVVYSIGMAFIALTVPVLSAGLSEIAPPRQTAGALGVFMGIMYVGALVTPYALGVIVDSATSPAAGWGAALAALGVFALVGGLCTLVFFNPPRDALRVRETETAKQLFQ